MVLLLLLLLFLPANTASTLHRCKLLHDNLLLKSV